MAANDLDPFQGDITKHVPRRNGILSEQELLTFREKFMENVAEGRMWGPSTLAPFSSFRTCPVFSVPKDKYDPLSTRVRMISNFAAGGLQSVNSLCSTPRPVGIHLRPLHLRDKIAQMVAAHGPGVKVWAADIPSCFRHQSMCARLLPLMVYELRSSAHGHEYFVDLCNPFGWTPSEWGWQMLLAALLWYLRRHGCPDVLAYEDNFFHFVPPSEDFDARCTSLDKLMDDAGVPLHERVMGTSFKGLGWIWHIDTLQMECPRDKFEALCSLLLR